MTLKEMLFFRAKAEVDALRMMEREGAGYSREDVEHQRGRFYSVWQLIEEAELVDEYQAWKEANGYV